MDTKQELEGFLGRTVADILNLTDRQYATLPQHTKLKIQDAAGRIDEAIDAYLNEIEETVG